MWLMNDSGALLTDYYEPAMAQVYLRRELTAEATFEVTIRRLPENWGFFVMAGLEELGEFLRQWRFSDQDIAYLRSLGSFDEGFLRHLAGLEADVRVRAMPEGTAFFAGEPVVEVAGPVITAQLLESAVLNILGYSILAATMAARCRLAAGGRAVADFGLRRCQGPISSIRAARGAQIAGMSLTSNVLAAKLLGMTPTGTMAHSFVEIHEDEERAFWDFAEVHGRQAVLLVDTYDSMEGIEKAVRVARRMRDIHGVRIKGIRLDSGDLAELSRLARRRFDEEGVAFMKIFASGDLDEYRIADLVTAGAPIDGFGVGTRLAVCAAAPAAEIVYKISTYDGRPLAKHSPGKATLPGRKSVFRAGRDVFGGDMVVPLQRGDGDLLRAFDSPESMEIIKGRLDKQLSRLPRAVQAVRGPDGYPVAFRGFGGSGG